MAKGLDGWGEDWDFPLACTCMPCLHAMCQATPEEEGGERNYLPPLPHPTLTWMGRGQDCVLGLVLI